MKRSLRNAFGLLLSSALILPLAAGAQTGTRSPVETGGKGPMAPMAVSPFAPNATLVESFDALAGTSPNQCPTGWTCTNLSSPLGSTNWFQGNSAVFPAQAGPVTGYIATNFNNTTGDNTISNWLLTPQVNFATGSELRFWTRIGTGTIFPDRLEVRISTAGASTNVGAT
ncbi:MAG TPA: choice-of-anchor J domain-containing protein, partial [Xanthomonadales bacterium]|nr:choice-of-anchor J domain-containing protein [Xanthomonadales bacterium]